jgi:CheY-specific phosphatase CheX
MKEVLKTAMTTSISEVLETMFFMTIEPVNVEDNTQLHTDDGGEKRYVSRIDFSGPLSGFFLLSIPKRILSTMTEFFMGMESEEVTETHLSGTISEAINMIAGNTFSKLDDQAVFNLEIPELLGSEALTDPEGKSGKEVIMVRIDTPDGHLGLQAFYTI